MHVPKIAEEFACIALGDKRLDRRAQQLVQRASAGPARSFPKMATDSSELESLYRFFENERVTAPALVAPHRLATAQRCNDHPVVVVAHDTTALSYEGNRDGLGPMSGEGGNGFYAHVSLAISGDDDQLPLGITALQTMVRGEPPYRNPTQRNSLTAPSGPQKWREGVDETSSLPIETTVIHVMDREADGYEFFADMLVADEHFVIRGKPTRHVSKSSKPGLPTNKILPLGDFLDERETRLTRRVHLRVRPKGRPHPPRAEREAELRVRAGSVVILRSKEQSEPESIRLNVVQVLERNAPDGEKPVEWTLFTTEPIDTDENIGKVIDYYRARWRIEEYFKALKSGCAIEERQLTTFAGLEKALAFFAPIAWRLLAMRVFARMKAPAPAACLFSLEDIEVIRRLAARRKHALAEEPCMQQVLLALAAIGGHLRRNGEPGWITIGRGYDDFCLARETLDVMREM